MQSSYETATAFTRGQEGGYTDDARDSGNWSSGEVGVGELIGSNLGCGAPATIAYMATVQPGFVVTAAWMKALPQTVYDGMASTLYWMPLACPFLPAGLDAVCFDFGWNTGVASAAKRLQWVVGATQDGEIGPATLAAVASCSLALLAAALTPEDAAILQRLLGVSADGRVGPRTLAALAASGGALRAQTLILALGEAQEVYYRGLANFSIYGQGWLNRTVARVEVGRSLAGSLVPEAAAFYAPERRAVPAIEPPDAPIWAPFKPGVPILAQAGLYVS